MKNYRKYILFVLLFFICVIITCFRFGIEITPFYTIFFNKLEFDIGGELEEVLYENSDFLEEEIVYTGEDLLYWQEVVRQLNNAEFKRGASLKNSGYGKHIITFKFKDCESVLEVWYAGENQIRFNGYVWTTNDTFYVDEDKLLEENALIP